MNKEYQTSKAKTVCVIGAGASGLTTIKQLLDEGHKPTCYEKNKELGGAFFYQNIDKKSASNSVYDNTVLTISNYFMSFSDFPATGKRRHWHHSEYFKYLKQYSVKFGLDQFIHYSTHVEKIQMIDQGKSGYKVTTKDHNGRVTCQTFDALAVCKGTNQIAKTPDIDGLDTFKGDVLHSSEYKNSDFAKNKRVLCIGIGESSADITREIATSADNCLLAIRSYPMLLPRNLTHSSSDSWTTRLTHFYHNQNDTVFSYVIFLLYWLLGKNFFVKSDIPEKDSFLQDAEKNMLDLDTEGNEECIKLIKSWNYLSKGGRFFTKNVSFVPYIINGMINVNASGIKSFSESSVTFNDNETHDIDCIVMCTGFQDDFSFFEGFELKDNNVRNMFMNAIPPDLPNCAFIGWCRPVSGGNPACSEMTARYFALLLSGKRILPNDVYKRIQNHKIFYQNMLPNSANYNAVVEWKHYIESLAELIGCLPNVKSYLLEPSVFVKLFAGSLVPHQFRLNGPHSMRDQSIGVIKQLDITLPAKHVIRSVVIGLMAKINKSLTYRHRSPGKYTTRTAEFFRPDVALTVEDVRHYAFRSDGFTSQFDKL